MAISCCQSCRSVCSRSVRHRLTSAPKRRDTRNVHEERAASKDPRNARRDEIHSARVLNIPPDVSRVEGPFNVAIRDVSSCFDEDASPNMNKWGMPSLDPARTHTSAAVVTHFVQEGTTSFTFFSRYFYGQSQPSRNCRSKQIGFQSHVRLSWRSR